MGYVYPGSGLRTKVDLSRQVYQNCETTAHFSGSTMLDQNLSVYLSGDTYGFYVSGTTGSTVVVSIGKKPDTTVGKSGFQINPNILVTGAGAADLEITSDGEIYRNVSSKKYKYDIKDLKKDHFDNLLMSQPRGFKYLASGHYSIGFIAEELESLGMKDFVVYDSFGLPDGVNYKLLSVGLLQLIKNLKEEVNELKSTENKNEQEVKIVEEDYQTNGEDLLIVKGDTEHIKLSNQENQIIIKSIKHCKITPIEGLIDEQYEEIQVDPKSCITLQQIEGNWYVLSSDGLKNT